MSNSINNYPNVVVDKPNQFPWKLYDMLQTAEKRNEEHIISWINDGKAFKVHDRDLFIEEYMKKMFNQTKFKSFQRQLNLWGFERVQNGPDKGSYFHPLFVRGKRESCQHLSRVRLKAEGKRSTQQGSLDKPESKFSPQPPSVSSTAAETISTTGPTTFPVTLNPPSVASAGNTSTTSPISLLGAYVDVPPATNSTTTETSSHEDSRQQQFAELIQHHAKNTSQKRRDMIRNAAIGLSPDMSIAVIGAPIYATATDISKHNTGDNDQKQRHQESESQDHALPLMPRTHRMEPQQPQEQAPKPLENPSQNDREPTPRQRSGTSGLEALLSVSAQRRREEELALLRGLSDHGAMSHRG